jgi:hypothetical protein
MLPSQKIIMKISYRSVTYWLGQNWRVLVASELLCLVLASIYVGFTPRIYEAEFSVRLPKMQIASPADSSKLEWKLMLSGLEFMRGMQNPLTFSNKFIQECLGEDSNANRKRFINSTQIRLLNHADVIHFSLRIEGRENVIRCANLLQARVLEDLNGVYEAQTLKNKENVNTVIASEKASPTDSLRISDSYIQPQVAKVIYAALLIGIFMAIFAVSLKAKYRA